MAALNIYQRMALITEEISTVAKNLEVGYGNNKYKAVSEADVLKAVKPIEKKHGVYSYPVKRDIVETDIMTSINTKGNEVQSKFMRIETVYRFVNIDDPEQHVEITTYGDGVDSQDKAPGKAMTYADKYALLKAYKIQTGDDPDAQASNEGTFKRAGADTVSETEKKRVWALLMQKMDRDAAAIWLKDRGIRYNQMTKQQYDMCVRELA